MSLCFSLQHKDRRLILVAIKQYETVNMKGCKNEILDKWLLCVIKFTKANDILIFNFQTV